MTELLTANLCGGQVRILPSKEHLRTFSGTAYFTEIKCLPVSSERIADVPLY
jgi:hypothetical protein